MPAGTSLEQYRRDDRDMLAVWERYKAAEATGRAAVRALAQVLACWSSAAQEPAGVVCDSCVSVADVVLATDTAQAWLNQQEEGND